MKDLEKRVKKIFNIFKLVLLLFLFLFGISFGLGKDHKGFYIYLYCFPGSEDVRELCKEKEFDSRIYPFEKNK